MLKRSLIIGWFVQLLFLALPWNSLSAKGLTVAVAANFSPAMEEIARLYTAKTGVPVQMTVSSTGKLYAQISNGAPYDLFFSADMQRPQKLAAEGRCDPALEYARGAVVLWTRNTLLCEQAATWVELLTLPTITRIGQANPTLAPYGKVVEKVLVDTGLSNRVQSQLVFGANVGQAFQYGASGAVDVAFIAESLANTPQGQKGCYFPVEAAELVSQGCCLVRERHQRKSAEAFLEFLFSEHGSDVLENYGYATGMGHP